MGIQVCSNNKINFHRNQILRKMEKIVPLKTSFHGEFSTGPPVDTLTGRMASWLAGCRLLAECL